MEKKFELLIARFLARYGKEILGDPARCKGLLKDFAKNEYQRECRLFLQIVEAGYHKTILGVKDEDIALTANRLVAQLQHDFFLGADVATEVIAYLFRVLRLRNLGTPIPGPTQTSRSREPDGASLPEEDFPTLTREQARTTVIAPSNAGQGKNKQGKQTVIDPVLEKMAANAETFLRLNKAKKALNVFQAMTNTYPEDYRGWWGLFRIETNDLTKIVINDDVLTHAQDAMMTVGNKDRQELVKQLESYNGIVKEQIQFISAEKARASEKCQNLRETHSNWLMLLFGLFFLLPSAYGYILDPIFPSVCLLFFSYSSV